MEAIMKNHLNYAELESFFRDSDQDKPKYQPYFQHLEQCTFFADRYL